MTAALLDELRAAVGPAHVLVDPEVLAGYEVDWTGRFSGRARCVVRPASTAEVAAALAACAAAGAPVVPQGGNTGLVGGGVPREGEIVLSTARLDAVGPLDAEHGDVVVGAGATLTAVRDAARRAGWDVAVDLAARDRATIGGMVATNAGGEHVVRYGATRRHVLGVEAVLADGTVIGKVPALRKDNTGYDWAGVLSGSEGTLAVITRVHLALVPHLAERLVALVALRDLDAAVALAARLRRELGSVLALEVMLADGTELVVAHLELPLPFDEVPPAMLLVELAASGSLDADATRLDAALADDAVLGTAVATDTAGRARLWSFRDRHTEAINAAGVPHKLDVTLPLGRLVEFAAAAPATVAAVAPTARTVLFGHVGDGNLHVNVLGVDPADDAVDHAVLALVASMGGSISAEHGIGVAKRGDLAFTRSPADIATMRALKAAFDPGNVLNPGVLLPDAGG